MEKANCYLSSYKTTIILLLIYAVAMAVATFIEKDHGTEVAQKMIYYSPAFFMLQFLLVINFVDAWRRYGYVKQKRWALLTVHLAFVVILGGALTTFLFGKEGTIHIREGESSNVMIMRTSKGVKQQELPFVLELTDFRLKRYPGSASPSSYESDLIVHVDGKKQEAKVFMNNVLDVKGYRFFQASYDQDERGTILSVNQDVAGRTITYIGYFLLFVGFIMAFIVKNSRFHHLARQLRETRKEIAKITAVTLFVIFSAGISAQTMPAGQNMLDIAQINAIPAAHAAQFGALPVQSRGRVMPINTLSSEILRKLHKEQTLGELNSDQFLLGLIAMPQLWMQVPFLASPDKNVAEKLQLSHPYFSYRDVFDEKGNYKLLLRVEEAYHKAPTERNNMDKELMKLDEQINIMYQLLNYGMLNIYPNSADPTHTWYTPGDNLSVFSTQDSVFITQSFNMYLSEVNQSLKSGNWSKPDNLLQTLKEFQRTNDVVPLINESKIKAELDYNRMNIFNLSKLLYFIFGGLLLVIAFMQLINERKQLKPIVWLLIGAIATIFAFHTFGIGLRWYISGYAPWSNSYETMVYVAWATVLAGMIFGRKNTLTFALGALFGGVILFVSSLNWMDPEIGQLVPVLKSPWLMFHVAVIVAAYGFFGIGFLLGVVNMCLMIFSPKSEKTTLRIKELSIINSMSLMVGLALMTIGTFLGAIWANESWGRYWGWDPKETWALITVIIYAIVTHIHLAKKWSNKWLFNLLSVFAFASVIMTFLGVNYFLSGMHSYGQTDGVDKVFIYIVLAFVAVGVLGFFSYRKISNNKRQTEK
ncbi:MAG: cytochrome c biogenesis protein CcsA [Petrimonas sp.]|jgi:cytochrome c-type biogenesis protein CcsB